jgi:hypothetical protein
MQSHPGPLAISAHKSLVGLRRNLQLSFIETTNMIGPQTNVNNNACTPAFVSPNNSTNNLHEPIAESQEHQQQQMKQDSTPVSPRPLKKRKIATFTTQAAPATAALASSIEEDKVILRRKELAAKLRANGVSRRMVLKPSAFARSVLIKNTAMDGCSEIPIIDVPPFPDPTSEDLEIHQKHSQTLYNFVRKGTNLEGFKKYVREVQREYKKTEAQPFRCCNKFGESLLHLACRRGRTEIARFLIEELTMSPRQSLAIRDDCFKTPLHDACWTPTPNFELVELILKHAPEQILMEDIRGNTPFDYVRREDYPLWLKFLWDRKSMLRGSSSTATSSRLISTQ